MDATGSWVPPHQSLYPGDGIVLIGPGHSPVPEPVSVAVMGEGEEAGVLCAYWSHTFTPAGLDPPRSPRSRMREGKVPTNLEEEVVDACWGRTPCRCRACRQQPLSPPLLPVGESGACSALPRAHRSDQRTRFGRKGEASASSQAGEPRTGPKGRTGTPPRP